MCRLIAIIKSNYLIDKSDHFTAIKLLISYNKEQQLSLLRHRNNYDRSPCNNETAFTMNTILHQDNNSVK